MKIAIASDMMGIQLKSAICGKLRNEGYELIEFGSFEGDVMPHSEAAVKVAKTIQSGEAQRGILICGTGMGVALTANKFKGVYAAPVESVFAAKYSRLINECNVLCLGAYLIGTYMALEMVEAFLKHDFAMNFEAKRKANLTAQVEKIKSIEDENLK